VKLLLAFLFTTLGVLAGQRQTLVNVVVDVSPEGRKVAHPTPDHPSYYFPVVGGYLQQGEAFAGEKRPNQDELFHLAAVELAKQGYLVAHPGKTPPPDIFLVFHWGPLNPETIDLDDVFDGGKAGNNVDGSAMNKLGDNDGMAVSLSSTTDTGSSTANSVVTLNSMQMLNILAGNTLKNIHESSGSNLQALIEATLENRYFIVITAYDFAATVHQKKKVPLWQAKMSVPSAGVAFDDVTPALIAAGGPLFGRETTLPQRITIAVTPEGSVTVGTPVIVHYHDATPPPPAVK
jgi:hypothetical protein